MKKMQIMGGAEIIISDEEAKKIMNVANNAKFIELSTGDFINVSSISCIIEYKGEPYVKIGGAWSSARLEKVFKFPRGAFYYIDREKKKIPLSIVQEATMQYITPEDEKTMLGGVKEQILLAEKRKDEEKKKRIEELEINRKIIETIENKWEKMSQEEKINELKKIISKYEKLIEKTNKDSKEARPWLTISYKRTIDGLKENIAEIKNGKVTVVYCWKEEQRKDFTPSQIKQIKKGYKKSKKQTTLRKNLK